MKQWWRKSFVVAFAIMIAFTLSTTVAHAQQQAGGSSQNAGVVQSGDPNTTGSYAGGSSQSSFAATDPLHAEGDASSGLMGMANSHLTGKTTMASGESAVTAKGMIDAGAGSVKSGGSGVQGNWTFNGNDLNFATGDNGTEADFSANENGGAPVSAGGNGSAKGMTKATETAGPNAASSNVNTQGQAVSKVGITSPQCATDAPATSASVKGIGSAGTQNVLGDSTTPGATFAAGSTLGQVSFGTTDSTQAQGSLGITGSTQVKLDNNSLQSVSQVHASAQASGH